MGREISQLPNENPDRLKRVLDAKYRTIGIDANALERQVKERKDREQAEKERDEAFAKLSRHFADQLTLMQQEADNMRRDYNKDVEKYRQTVQSKYSTREWDLNRPDAKQLDLPARVGDDDSRLGPSSLQKFDGEDLTSGSRMKAQMEQSRQWWNEQSAIKEAVKAAEKEAEAAHAELVRYQDMLQNASAAEESSVRRELNRLTAEYNKRQAEEVQLRKIQAKQEELAANLAELDAAANAPLLTEDPNIAASSLSAYRVRKDHYKGMTAAERQAIADTRLAQIEEKRARDAQASLEEASYARTQNSIFRALNEQAQRADDFRKQQAQKVQEILTKQADEKKERDAKINDMYRNKIAPEFFQQFGTSMR
mmetsp:Transcript_9223/g.17301  ORF Transcript_9223/g.17301 Transcript_9223/m.17301 type:complete len:368 (-) Transcript_9223:329-1432(-)|eukprot:CAMPEP_0175055686 /NCGR_PEP_ID=MMETSP0052_2-20121109/10226_1 /TAXON_ID=51329 ORGANISM="Polytomella parva, Strain SAG 63-3" /NCGR_SAMPLE_ID=MMETSP0052_2 /ASSEMBLY_ACC=CAM_ASM_000194 /LENGTH=367 /DNA_ID=CAMNT_0016320575 /DNA_START=30 /DNA_END=1133 /DNA_ORIENTATION=-